MGLALAKTGLPPAPPTAVRGIEEKKRSVLTLLERLLLGWLVVRTLLWTAAALLTQPNPPMDVVEMLYFGQQWGLGYPKHPPLTAWLAEIARWLTPGSFLGIYALSCSLVAATQWCAWRLAREMTGPRSAVLAALCLDGLVFFTHRISEFNNNITVLFCWAWAILACYLALRRQRLIDWLGLGLAIGFGLLSKYSMVFLLPPLLALLTLEPQARGCWRTPGPYLGGAVALLVLAPHVWWLLANNFPGLTYALERTVAPEGNWHPLALSAAFLGSQLVRLIPVLLILVPVLSWGRIRPRSNGFDLRFLLYVVIGPVLLHLLLPLVTGRNVRDTYGVQLWTFLGVLLLVLLPLRENPRSWHRAWTIWGMVAFCMLASSIWLNIGSGIWRGRPGRIHFPGRELALAVEMRWRGEQGRPLRLVGGDGWLAGNVSCHGQDHADVLPIRDLDYDGCHPRFSAHLLRSTSVLARTEKDDQAFLHQGGVLLWNAAELGDDVPLMLRQRFPGARACPALVLPWQCRTTAEPVRVGMAMVRGCKP